MAQIFSNQETPRSSHRGMWVVELNIAGCTIRRRAAKRRHLFAAPLPLVGPLLSRPAGTA